MTLICPKKAMETITIQKPVHILKLPMACSATSPNFYLPPRYGTPTLDVNISLNMANLHMINISAQDFCIWKHLGSNRSDMQLQHQQAYPQFQYTRFTSIYSMIPYQSKLSKRVNRTHWFHLDSVFIPRDVCFSYRIAYTNRTRLILLLLLLVLTCQLSAPTFTTR